MWKLKKEEDLKVKIHLRKMAVQKINKFRKRQNRMENLDPRGWRTDKRREKLSIENK